MNTGLCYIAPILGPLQVPLQPSYSLDFVGLTFAR